MTVDIHTSSELFRAEDLLRPEIPEKFVEIIEGELVVMNPSGWKHNEIGYNFVRLFDEFCRSRPQMHFAPDNTGFLLQRNPDVLLCPDASLFRWRPRDEDRPWSEFCPDVAVEVLSPSNNSAEIAYKRRKYFEAGAEQVWIVLPAAGTIEFHFRDGRRIIAQGDEIVTGEGIAAGMKIELRKLFSVRQQ